MWDVPHILGFYFEDVSAKMVHMNNIEAAAKAIENKYSDFGMSFEQAMKVAESNLEAYGSPFGACPVCNRPNNSTDDACEGHKDWRLTEWGEWFPPNHAPRVKGEKYKK